MLKISLNGVKARLFDLSSSELLEEYNGFWAYQTENGLGISDHVVQQDNYLSIFVNYDFNNNLVSSIELINSVQKEEDLNKIYIHTHKDERTKIMNEIANLFPNTEVVYIVNIESQEDDLEDNLEELLRKKREEEEEEEEAFYAQQQSEGLAAIGIAHIIRNGFY